MTGEFEGRGERQRFAEQIALGENAAEIGQQPGTVLGVHPVKPLLRAVVYIIF